MIYIATIVISRRRKHATDWFSRFNKFLESQIDPLDQLLESEQPHKPARIAVLDTGVNEKHRTLYANSKRIVKRRNWVEDDNEMKDLYVTGHGTHTAALLLETAPLAHICVARISKDEHLGKEEHIRDVCSQ